MSQTDNRECPADRPEGTDPPVPCKQALPDAPAIRKGIRWALLGAGAAAVAASTLVWSESRALPGATRSSRLVLQRRQAEIEQATAEADATAAQPIRSGSAEFTND